MYSLAFQPEHFTQRIKLFDLCIKSNPDSYREEEGQGGESERCAMNIIAIG